ncbi:MAG: catalase-peroxidase, partial [Nitrospina sp.]|nr:catalase-peroxidase [Nitrospina sp.]
FDPKYKKIAKRFLDNPDEYQKSFAKAWYKLTHRDMGPSIRYLGEYVPNEELIWQDPVPTPDYRLVNKLDIGNLKEKILGSGLTISELVETAWASASTFRASDMRGGANGARIALLPQKDWAVNNPKQLSKVLGKLKKIQKDFNESFINVTITNQKVSLADLIVLGGDAAVEKAARNAGFDIEVPFQPGRSDATQEQTDVKSFALLEPQADAFRNYFNKSESYRSPVEMLVDKADQLNLTVPEMVTLIGGMRVLNTNVDDSNHGILTSNSGKLNNDFFVNLLDMSTKWRKSKVSGLYEGLDRETDKVKYTATSVDLVFGSNSELRAVVEIYAFDDSKEKFVKDFVKAWTKVMRLDRFDLK